MITDISGQRVGMLVVLGSHNRKPRYWRCRCDCGTTKTVRDDHLRSGRTKSCGCLKHIPKESPRTTGYVACTVCGTITPFRTKGLWDIWRRTGRAYCTDRCRDFWVSRNSSETMHRTNKRLAPITSARMRLRNPMKKAATRAKVSTALRALGHKPPIQGGNGRGLTKPEKRLLRALGKGWKGNVIVPTKKKRGSGWPYHYKIDVANQQQKIAIEIDGFSHTALAIRRRDKRKDRFLTARGWRVLRFKNKAIMSDLNNCISAVKAATPWP